MKEKPNLPFLDIDDLRVGVYIHLESGWLSHPFPRSSFRISSIEQIETLRGLGLKRVRWSPRDSDVQLVRTRSRREDPAQVGSPVESALRSEAISSFDPLDLQAKLRDQKDSIQGCEQRFAEATKVCRLMTDLAARHPVEAAERARALSSQWAGDMACSQQLCVRLLTEAAGDRLSVHAVNVALLSILLGRALGWGQVDITEMGIGALFHDIGKLDVTERLRHAEPHFSMHEQRAYEDHISFGVMHARKMGLSSIATLVIAQHHELSDGSGVPLHLVNDRISLAARVVALVNRYDNLCNPHVLSSAITPHEAISQIYARSQSKFDPVILGAFIKMMGVYPVGSLVQLNDGRFAMVVAIHSGRPLRPSLIIHNPKVPRHEALIVDMADYPLMSILRSVKPISLPADALIYLSPRQRVAYFFEPVRVSDTEPEAV
jgi:putative nucleotidyltransferase with HDIG domain